MGSQEEDLKSIDIGKHGETVFNNIRVLTYNFFLRPPGIKNNKNDYKNTRLKHFIKTELNNWDIIAFQECFGSYSSRRKYLIKKAKEYGFLHHCKNPKARLLSTRFIDGGLLILSRFPIVEYDFVEYSKSTQSDSMAAKGILHAKIKITKPSPKDKEGESEILHLFNTQMQASYEKHLSKLRQKYESIRYSQIEMLKDFVLSKTKDDAHSVVLMGDFNVNGRNPHPDGLIESEEYLKMKRFIASHFQFDDLLHKSLGFHPITTGDMDIIDGEIIAKEIYLTKPIDQKLCKSLDYIFWIPRKSGKENESENVNSKEEEQQDDIKSTLKPNSCKVEQFVVKDVNFPCTQLSDHYGLSLTLQY